MEALEKKELNIRIVLLLLDIRSPTDTYSLIRTMTRRFAINNFKEILDSMVLKQYVLRMFKDANDRVGYYEITSTGREYLVSHFDGLKENMSQVYSDQSEFIDILFNNYKDR